MTDLCWLANFKERLTLLGTDGASLTDFASSVVTSVFPWMASSLVGNFVFVRGSSFEIRLTIRCSFIGIGETWIDFYSATGCLFLNLILISRSGALNSLAWVSVPNLEDCCKGASEFCHRSPFDERTSTDWSFIPGSIELLSELLACWKPVDFLAISSCSFRGDTLVDYSFDFTFSLIDVKT